MSDRERINGIRKALENTIFKSIRVFGQDFLKDDLSFLLDEAERAQDLEKRLDAEVESGYQMEGQLQDTKAENARLREALEFYADRAIFKPRTRPIYGPFGYAVYDILEDYGVIARRALEGESE